MRVGHLPLLVVHIVSHYMHHITVRKVGSFDPFWILQFHTFPHHWIISLAKHSPMTFTNVLENLITVWNVKQAVGLHCI